MHQNYSLVYHLSESYFLYYFHHPGFGPKDSYLEEAVKVMEGFKKEGKIRCIGLSAYSDGDFDRLVPTIKPDALQSWANIPEDQFIRSDGRLNALMKKHGCHIVIFAPLQQGRLLGKWTWDAVSKLPEDHPKRKDAKYSKEGVADLEKKLAKLRERFGTDMKDLARVALQYVLSFDVVGCVIPGFRNLEQVQCNLEAADKPLSGEDVKFIQELFGTR